MALRPLERASAQPIRTPDAVIMQQMLACKARPPQRIFPSERPAGECVLIR
jgi:hypothetical protein